MASSVLASRISGNWNLFHCLDYTPCGQAGEVGSVRKMVSLGRAIGGEDALERAWPWQVLITRFDERVLQVNYTSKFWRIIAFRWSSVNKTSRNGIVAFFLSKYCCSLTFFEKALWKNAGTFWRMEVQEHENMGELRRFNYNLVEFSCRNWK